MGIRARYFLTAAGLIIFLVSSVAVARARQGATAFSDLDNAKTKGSRDAPIHLTIYSDFQCPACLMALAPVDELQKEFSDVMQIGFRHYPLEKAHRWAVMAAAFAECAAEQGKFWEFHDKLYQEQAIWSKSEDAIPFFARYAAEVGLNHTNLERCIGDPKTLARIQHERSTGERFKVQSTPTFFINGHILVGAIQLKEQGKNIIIDELKKSGKFRGSEQA